MSNLNRFQPGDVVHVPIIGPIKHYGIVVHAGYGQPPVIRTVLSSSVAPVNQCAFDFSGGKIISALSYPGQLPRWKVVENALSVLSFDYHLLFNNCENFYRRAHGLSDISPQAVIGSLALAGCVAWSLATKSPIALKA
jgi:hypothetical protein